MNMSMEDIHNTMTETISKISWGYSQQTIHKYEPYENNDLPLMSSSHDEVTTDSKGRRIILRDALYENPQFFIGTQKREDNLHTQNQYVSWHSHGWQKAGEEPQDTTCYSNQIQNRRQNKVEKKLNEMLAQPVNMTKAERMMQKMGWQGGALGRYGEGIIEPIAPNAAYATKTAGLGQNGHKKPKRMKPIKEVENKEYFITNVLLNVLDFVRNDYETELVFDRYLWKVERKRIHNLIEQITNSKNVVALDLETVTQMDIAHEIQEYNRYVLCTESEGVVPNRYLCLYKEAPENVYLVTPDDLRNKICEPESAEETFKFDENETNLTHNGDSKENTTNVTNLQTKDLSMTIKMDHTKENSDESTMTKLIYYFVEFLENDTYGEFRFLGSFKIEENDAINNFITMCICREYDKIHEKAQDIFKNEILTLEIKNDYNGRTVLYKSKSDAKSHS